MGRHNDIAGPVESKYLAISVLKKADCPYDPLNDLDLLSFFLSFPKESPAARHEGRRRASKIGNVGRSMNLRRKFTLE
jgi:hypothetical protein